MSVYIKIVLTKRLGETLKKTKLSVFIKKKTVIFSTNLN